MFLLILLLSRVRFLLDGRFTFQYVSINTEQNNARRNARKKFTFQYVSINTVCSTSDTLYVFEFTFQYVSINTCTKQSFSCPSTRFTFQYVSINTWIFKDIDRRERYLHSNMFLLIPAPTVAIGGIFRFTFQYVSINTKKNEKCFIYLELFTFQYVPINTIMVSHHL